MFVKHYVKTGDAPYSSYKAGFSHANAQSSRILNRPEVAAEIRRQQLEKIQVHILPVASDRHLKLLEDDNVKPADHAKLIKLAYDFTIGAKGGDGREKAIDDMTLEELEALKALAESSMKALQVQADTIEGRAVDVSEKTGDIFG